MTGNDVLMTHSVLIDLVNFQAWLEVPQAITVLVNHAICQYQKDWNGDSVKKIPQRMPQLHAANNKRFGNSDAVLCIYTACVKLEG